MGRPEGRSAALQASPPHQPTGVNTTRCIIMLNENAMALFACGEVYNTDYTVTPAAGSSHASSIPDERHRNGNMATSNGQLGIPSKALLHEWNQSCYDGAWKAAAGPIEGSGCDEPLQAQEYYRWDRTIE